MIQIYLYDNVTDLVSILDIDCDDLDTTSETDGHRIMNLVLEGIEKVKEKRNENSNS